MSQTSGEFDYRQLRSLSFDQLFRLFAAIATWKWTRRVERSLVVQRAQECDERRVQQPAYAAVLLHESGDAQRRRPGDWGNRKLVRDLW